MMVKLSTFGSFLLCTLVCFSFGCQPEEISPLGTVSGQVTLKGDTFSHCKVTIFCPDSKESRAGRVDPDGAYVIRNIVPGDYVVTIIPPPLDDDEEAARIPIPKKLKSRKTSGLSVTVTANENSELDIELKP